jgi:hypothetical protein
VAQIVEHQLSKHETLSSKPSNTKKKKKILTEPIGYMHILKGIDFTRL